jgi:glycosyltransferase involved in cell wall biosynthesis
MAKVSIIIPARNEEYLEKTIISLLERAEGEIEIFPVLDGYLPEKPIDVRQYETKEKRVFFLHNEKAAGQRGSINQAAKKATGKYLLKTDGHSLFDQGFDLKLQEDCEPDWTVIPRMYNLDAEKWEPKWRKKTDFMFIYSPDHKTLAFRAWYWADASTSREFPEEYKAYKKATWRQGDICDVMTSQGACWFMHMDRFWELGGMDEGHGSWGQVGVEVALKAWLSGGSLKVNKKTWFAHMFRKRAPYHLAQPAVDRARAYSIDFWTKGKWPLQKRSLSWLVEKFAPVPTWKRPYPGDNTATAIPDDLTILYYTANVVAKGIESRVIDSLKNNVNGTPIISISQEKMNLGQNICVGRIGRSLQNIYKQVLIGAQAAKTKYVALTEDDCIYTPEHFSHRPKNGAFAYNLNRWLLHLSEETYSYRKRPILSQCIADREQLIANLEERFALKEIPDKHCGEMGVFDKKLGMTEYPYETFETTKPNLVICHKKNTTGRKLLGTDAEPRASLEPYGDAVKLKKDILKEDNVPITSFGRKYGRSAKKNTQFMHIASIIFTMDELEKNRMAFADPRKVKTLKWFLEVFPPFIKKVHDGEWKGIMSRSITNEDIVKEPYFDYLVNALNPSDRDPLTGKGRRHVIKKMRNAIDLYYDIKAHGLKAPLDVWRHTKHPERLTITRGVRRLEIMKILGKKTVPCRLYKSKEHYRIYNAPPGWHDGSWESNKIHDLAIKQFMRLEHEATDKYWVHNYTKLYDRHLGHMRDRELKILEIGVLRGASLLLWKDAFPKAKIFGLDKNMQVWQKFLKGQERIKVFVGRQEDTEFLKREVVPAGPYDIIIDDGGHKGFEQQPSFDILWDSLNKDGFYILEDLYANYRQEKWSEATRRGFGSTMGYLKDKIDAMNMQSTIRSMTFYYNICFVEKMGHMWHGQGDG